jgi:CubicO group peptidase (beta-lactamase class C family)
LTGTEKYFGTGNFWIIKSLNLKIMIGNRIFPPILLFLFVAGDSGAQTAMRLAGSLDPAIISRDYPNIDAILIAQHKKIIFEKYFNGLTKDSLHDTRSSFKSITAILLGIAIDKGFIKDVHEKVYSFFPEYKNYKNWVTDKDSMTIEDLLEMKSGFDCEEWNDTRDCEDEMTRSNDWVKFSLDLPLVHKPGTVWSYMSSNPMILSGIISNASHMPLDQFAAKYLLGPLNIKEYRWTKDKMGHSMTAGSFYAMAEDMVKIGQLVLNRGVWNGQQLVTAAWLERATTPITKIENFSNVGIARVQGAIPQPTFYGYFWYNEKLITDKFKYNAIFSSGNGGQFIILIKALDLVVVFNGHSYNSRKSKLVFDVLVRYILPYLESANAPDKN